MTSDFYNCFSRSSREILCEIVNLGHEIGVHYDEVAYPDAIADNNKIVTNIQFEAKLLESAIGQPVTTVSMHRPSEGILESDLQIPGMINSYGKTYFKDFKYISDSRKRWREPVLDIVKSKEYDRLHILTHAFWYEEENWDLKKSVATFINSASRDRYRKFSRNFTNLQNVMVETEVAG